jgi:site-specific recombinase XerD
LETFLTASRLLIERLFYLVLGRFKKQGQGSPPLRWIMCDFQNLMNNYLGSNCPLNTRVKYSKCLNEWVNFAQGESIKLLSFKYEDVQKFVSFLEKKPGKEHEFISASTVNYYIKVLFYFYNFLQSIGHIKRNAFATHYRQYKRVKGGDRKVYQPLPLKAVKKLLKIPCDIPGRAILALLFGLGLRKSELLSLNINDIVLGAKGAELRLLRTKAGKIQFKPMARWVANAVSKQVDYRLLIGAKKDEPLFLSAYKKRLSAPTLYRFFVKTCKEIGLNDYSPHCARVTAATKLRGQGADIRTIQKFLGHKSISSTMGYDRFNDDTEVYY